jgi:hypothetical protein
LSNFICGGVVAPLSTIIIKDTVYSVPEAKIFLISSVSAANPVAHQLVLVLLVALLALRVILYQPSSKVGVIVDVLLTAPTLN